MTAKYEFIDGEKDNFKVARMCDWIGVSRSGYYGWRDRDESATAERRERLARLIKVVFDASHRTYGYRRIHAALTRSGETCSPELVRQLMRAAGLVACQPRPWRWSLTAQDGRAHRIPDLVARDFTAGTPGSKMVGDITCIRTKEGWVYLATVIDCYSKKVIGYAMDTRCKTSLIEAAVDGAAAGVDIAPGAIFHSDRGSSYTSDSYARKLKSMGVRQSVGRTGVCYDNAMAESFFASLKNEWLHRIEFEDRASAKRAVIRYIEGFYNNRRLHSGLGYRTPQEAEDEYREIQLAA